MIKKLLSINTVLFPLLALLSTALLMMLSGYYNFGAEGIVFNSIQRLREGLPYLSGPLDFPLALTTYSPVISWLLHPFVFFLSPENIILIGTIARIIAVAIIGLQYLVLRKSKLIPVDSLNLLFFLYITFLPDALLSLKPDSLAFLCEIIGFVLFQKFLKEDQKKFLVLSSVFLGVGFLSKMNTIGVGLGLGLYLLFERRIIDLVIFVVAILTVAIVGFGCFYWLLGDDLILNLLASTKSYFMFTFDHFISTSITMLKLMLYPIAIFIYLGWQSFKEKKIERPISYFLPIVCSFFIAFIGQFKIGAFLNYFFGVFLILILLAGPSFQQCILQTQKKTLLFLSLTSLLFIYHLIGTGLIAGNNLYYYPWSQVREYLQKQNFAGKIYVPDNNASLYFWRYNNIGSSTEVFLELSPMHSENMKKLTLQLSEMKPFQKAIIVGSNCEKWKPSGIFAGAIADFVYLEKKFRKICVFRRD